MIDWRGLLNELGVPFRERGKNISRDSIGVCCPFCGDDHNYHMNIAQDKEAFYCRRDPTHAGHSFVKLLSGFRVKYDEAKRLLHTFSGGEQYKEAPPKEAVDMSDKWARFKPLERPHTDYLAKRHFPNAQAVADRYDLRCAYWGKWAAASCCRSMGRTAF